MYEFDSRMKKMTEKKIGFYTVITLSPVVVAYGHHIYQSVVVVVVVYKKYNVRFLSVNRKINQQFLKYFSFVYISSSFFLNGETLSSLINMAVQLIVRFFLFIRTTISHHDDDRMMTSVVISG